MSGCKGERGAEAEGKKKKKRRAAARGKDLPCGKKKCEATERTRPMASKAKTALPKKMG